MSACKVYCVAKNQSNDASIEIYSSRTYWTKLGKIVLTYYCLMNRPPKSRISVNYGLVLVFALQAEYLSWSRALRRTREFMFFGRLILIEKPEGRVTPSELEKN